MNAIIEARYQQYVDALNTTAIAKAKELGYYFHTVYELQDKGGPTAKYRRITYRDLNDNTGEWFPGASVEAFVDDDGHVYYPDGWKRPQLKTGPRFNVADDTSFAELLKVAGHSYYLHTARYRASLGITLPEGNAS